MSGTSKLKSWSIDTDEYLIQPDTILPDSLGYEDESFDTLIYSDGLDTIIEILDTVTEMDSLNNGSILGRYAENTLEFVESSNYQYREYSGFSGGIVIGFGGQPKSINHGLYGINVTGMFDRGTLPNDGTSEYGWQWLADLAPEVLRFPSGSYGKFMHLLHNTDGSNSIGYGYDIYEIARYFDWTDRDMQIDELTESDINTVDETILKTWMAEKYVDSYTKFLEKFNKQKCETSRYIDDFIDLVEFINESNPGRPPVKVIVCLNILSETAAECKTIADYLRQNNVNVIGVEMGNETYSDFFCDAMGFHYFKKNISDEFTGNYWDYINGENYSDEEGDPYTEADDAFAQTELFNVLSDEMEESGAHDYISAFKSGSGFNYKIGVVGKPLGEDYAFRMDLENTGYGCDPFEDWNEDLRSVYSQIATGTVKKKFDAVILHTYYEPQNWQNIAKDNITPVITCNDADADPLNDPWHLNFYDTRLQAAFNGIIGIGNVTGNFRDFIKSNNPADISYKVSFDKFNETLNFDIPSNSTDKKEIWITEWNLKTENDGLNEIDQKKVNIYSNGFIHGYLLMQWFLKNIKINFDPEYRQNFFTYATLQNFAGGVSTDLLTTSDPEERELYGTDGCPFSANCLLNCIYDANFDKRTYFVRRTSYFVTELYSEIFKNNLKYLPATYLITLSNSNMQPTVFVDPLKEYLYVYFTNVKSTSQNYSLDPDGLINLYSPLPTSVAFGLATVNYIQGSQLYSTSGKNSLYDAQINSCYPGHDHGVEIDQILVNDNEPECDGSGHALNACLTAPPYSIGYFKIRITPDYLPPKFVLLEEQTMLWDLNIYPNPGNDELNVFVTQPTNSINTNFVDAEIYDMYGKMIFNSTIPMTAEINIADFAQGVYQLVLITSDHKKLNKKFIKI